MPTNHEFMYRALFLAQLGAGKVAPNPLVGAVLVHDGLIIGEGWHEKFGKAHAEVNCLNSVKEADRNKIAKSTIYVTLEPCAHHGKTPPCADLIVENQIPKVVIAVSDSFEKVDGKGIAKLKAAGVEVVLNCLEKEARYQNRRFFTFLEKKRPFIILKWAQSADGFIAPLEGKKVMLSNKWVGQYVQKMRSEEAAILVGFQTALKDNPLLTNRFKGSQNPLRIVIDPNLELPDDLMMKTDGGKTLIFNFFQAKVLGACQYIQMNRSKAELDQILDYLYQMGINSLIVEGGTKTLNAFISANLWDEAHVICTQLRVVEGLIAPNFNFQSSKKSLTLGDNTIYIFEQNIQ